MKKLISGIITIVIISFATYGQTYTATLAMEEVDISNIEVGEEIVVPIKLVNRSGGKILGFQFFIEYDHSIITWKGSTEDPLLGVLNFNAKIPYSPDLWLFNDNGTFLAVSYSDNPTSSGVDIPNGEIFFEYIFTYNGGLNKGEKLELVWGTKFEQEEGIVVKGATELYSELLDLYQLKLIEGSLNR